MKICTSHALTLCWNFKKINYIWTTNFRHNKK